MEQLSVTITSMQVSGHSSRPFQAHWRHFGLGPLELNFLQASPQMVCHTPALINNPKKTDYDLVYMDKSFMKLKHCGRSEHIPQGSFVLLDNREPYELLFTEDNNCLTVHLDSQWLRRWLPHPEMLVAAPNTGKQGWGRPLTTLLQTISKEGFSDVILPREVIADQLGAMLALMAGGTQPASRYQSTLFSRLKRIIHERFDDIDLGPETAAETIGISKRHLHNICAQANTTFGSILIDIRLCRASDMLKDGRFKGYRISDISWACGFADPSHFARRFRERFGASPLEYRKLKN